jgi:hypothetical protein
MTRTQFFTRTSQNVASTDNPKAHDAQPTVLVIIGGRKLSKRTGKRKPAERQLGGSPQGETTALALLPPAPSRRHHAQLDTRPPRKPASAAPPALHSPPKHPIHPPTAPGRKSAHPETGLSVSLSTRNRAKSHIFPPAELPYMIALCHRKLYFKTLKAPLAAHGPFSMNARSTTFPNVNSQHAALRYFDSQICSAPGASGLEK